MPSNELVKKAEAIKYLLEKRKYRFIDSLFQEEGAFCYKNYPKHMDFMRATKKHHICAFIGANGTGKSTWGSCVMYWHMSGKYPTWWEGHRFTKPLKAWICARENKQLRDSIQDILFGKTYDMGTGVIPKEDLVDDKGVLQTWAMSGTANCVGSFSVKHYDSIGNFDGWSTCEFKTYAQGWQEFQGSNKNLIWLDEEPDDAKVYSECLSRTRGPKGKEGHIFCTFTPLLGYSTIYLSFLPMGQIPVNGINPNNPNKWVCRVSWDDVPHLSESWKISAIEEYKLTDPNSIDARTKGIAAQGLGRIYPVDEEFVLVDSFAIPDYWPRAYGLDFGYVDPTAAIWIAQDPHTHVKYVYAEYCQNKQIESIHADYLRGRGGDWMWGLYDPSGGGKRDDGTLRASYYMDKLGLKLYPADNALIAGIAKLLNEMETGTMKIMKHCSRLINILRMYRWSEKDPSLPARGQDDHELDAWRYCNSKFEEFAISYAEHEEQVRFREDEILYPRKEEPRDPLTGY